MTMQAVPDVIIYLCKNCLPHSNRLPAQWTDSGMQIQIKEVPCSGKIDTQYILHALEGGVGGVCIITCLQGECTLAQGNYRAEIRVRTVKRLLEEIGLDPRRAEILRCAKDETLENIKELVEDAAHRLCGLVRIPA
ncbi:MAG: hydrogenase iron-sulfur subunit [Chitinivibrionales bacterium]|nr:hydrogenase iron-sulfur subunit [Chitinivibrionales bacterium]